MAQSFWTAKVALEFAAKRKAILLGKPSKEFFKLAVGGIAYGPCEVARPRPGIRELGDLI